MDPSLSPATSRLRGALNVALVVGAGLLTAVAVSVAVGLSWWALSLPPIAGSAATVAKPGAHTAAPPAAPQAARPAQRPAPQARGEVRSPHAPPPVPPAAVSSAPAPPVAAPPVVAPPTDGGDAQPNPDGQKNRAIARGLIRLGEDPELQRELGVPAPDTPQN